MYKLFYKGFECHEFETMKEAVKKVKYYLNKHPEDPLEDYEVQFIKEFDLKEWIDV